MLQRIRVAALAVIIGAGAMMALTPSAATAAPPAPGIARVSISPAPPIDVTTAPVTATFSFFTKNADKAEFQLKAPGEVSAHTPIALTKGKEFHGWTKWTGTRAFTSTETGTWAWRALAAGAGGSTQSDGTFAVVVKPQVETSIADVDARPDLAHRGDLIKVSGRLLAAGKGYAGQTVSITFRARGADAYKAVTTARTGRGGWFAATVRVATTGWWRAEFAATAAAKASVSDADRVDVKRRDLGSEIAGFDARPEPVDKGDRLHFTGALQVERRGGVAGQRVAIFFKAHGSSRWEYVTSDVTGRHGRFWASATAVASGWWRAEYAGARGVRGSVSAPDWVTVNVPAPPPAKADTRLIKFNAYPEPIKRGKHLRFWGKLQVDDEGTWEGYAGEVALFFKPLKSKKWVFVKSFDSSDSGRLFTKARAWKSGHWRFVFKGDDDTNGSGSRTDFVRVKR
ncbi:MAG TPA: hypothetical protein VFV66_33505 [Nonomuraea sp.]|nr:hypothetical protein [Nonomuraea sp.]